MSQSRAHARLGHTDAALTSLEQIQPGPEGHTLSVAGDSIPQKLRFEKIAADNVRQVFEQSNDGGAS